MGASVYLNCQKISLRGVDIEAYLLSVNSNLESLVLLDQAVEVCIESGVNQPIDSSDSDESNGGENDVA
ncbi:hypothetical protein V6N12_062030 [Hibiscus sabdariffa]|uniref:Uncharacterized protein n=1 Tax=Hibiscus sabdariffa TaxID=183260 RepID=A0ABR2DYT5_9ROSI